MATPIQESFSTQLSEPLRSPQENPPELDQRVARLGMSDVIENIANTRIDRTQTAFSDLEIHQSILKFQGGIIEAIDQLDKISGNIKATARYWKIPETSSEVQELLKEIDFYKKTLDSYTIKLTKIKRSSENLYLLLKRIYGVQIPQMSDFRFPPEIPLTQVVITSILEPNTSERTGSMVELIVKEFGNHLAKCDSYEKQFILYAGCKIANIALKIGAALFEKYKSKNEAKQKISEVKLEFIKCELKMKLERINGSLERAISESEGSLKMATEQSLKQVKESIESRQQSNPHKSEMVIVKELRDSPLCAGLILPLKSALNCSPELAWELILEQFRIRPRSAF